MTGRAVGESDLRLTVALPSGIVAVSAVFADPGGADALVALAPGAGAGLDHPFLVGHARALGALGLATLRFQFPYREAGRSLPGPPQHAMMTWLSASATARRLGGGIPVWAAGKSYGGRMASLAVAEGVIGPAGLIYLGYPLHPPGRPDALRAAHLPRIAVPQLFVQGRTDPFVQPPAALEDAVAACPDATLRWVDGGHSFEVAGRPRTPEVVGAELAAEVAAFVRTHRPAA